MHLEPYLFFDGNCEEALKFYAEVFGGEIAALNRFEGSPMGDAMPPEHRNRVMHASFVSPTLRFMASDGNRAAESSGSRISLSLSSKDVPESQHVFDALAAGGTIAMPFAKTFWGAMFGIITDRYGIDWMVNCEL